MNINCASLDCLIISTGRAASTAIYRYLDTAGSLRLPNQKEPHHWCNIQDYGGLYDLIWKIYVSDEKDYWDLYAKSKVSLDASCGYFFYLDDVIRNLHRSNQNPKIIFLYREPASRALSWFNERSKKQLTSAENVIADIKTVPAPGLWWEHYYDNVLYDTRFRQLQENFDDVVAVNYSYFAEQTKLIIAKLLSYLQLEPVGLEQLKCDPVNSSQEALANAVLTKYTALRSIGRYLPVGFKHWFRRQLVQHRGIRLKEQQLETYATLTDVASLLPVSSTEYKRFRARIEHQDLYYWRNPRPARII